MLCPDPCWLTLQVNTMAIPNNQLFLDRFIEVNLERYRDNPSVVQMLQGLTLDQIQFTNFRKTTLPSGQVAYLYDMEYPNVFIAHNQRYYPADYAVHKVAVFQEKDKITLENLPTKTKEGMYYIDPTGGRMLVTKGKLGIEHIKALVKSNCRYDLADEQITVSQDYTTFTVDSPTVFKGVGIVESLYDDLPRYNGRYRYDGAVKAL